MARSETTTRVLVALAGVPVALAAVYLGRWALALLLGALALLGAREWFRMAALKGARPLALLGGTIALALVALAAVAPGLGPDGVHFGLLLALAVPAVLTSAIWGNGVEGEPLVSSAVTLFGAVYTGGLLSFGLFLRHLPGVADAWHGTALVFTPVLLTWTSDSCAYFVGRAFGRRKLIPRVSPGKTVEGALGALVGAVVVAVAYAALVLDRFPTYTLELWQAALLGAAVSVAAQLGDLAESLLKRDSGVKDSGTLLPGHGGALDRVDALLFTLPLAYLVFRYGVEPELAIAPVVLLP